MGYEFALHDKWRLDELDPLGSRLYVHKHYPEKSSLSETEVQELKEKALLLYKERYELINSRRKEMHLTLEDLDKLQQEYQEVYFSN